MGTLEVILVVAVLLLLFGSKKITEFARGMGEATKELKKVKKDVDDASDQVKEVVKK